jgi:LysM repeat protein
MKHIRISPWLILVLAFVLVFAAGCDRPDPQVAIETPQPMNVPQQPAQPVTAGTPAPGGEAVAPEGAAPEGAATPTLPPIVVATTEGAGAATGEGTPAAGGGQNPQVVPTVAPPVTPAAQATAQTQPPAQVNAQGNVVHTVKSGETLFSIGRLYGVNPYSIAAANNIPYPYIIYPGQQLIIPIGTTPPGPTPPGPTPPGPTPPPQPGQCRFYHVVRPGENLYRISLAYGVPMSTIAAANGIVNYNLIFAGQTLCIP